MKILVTGAAGFIGSTLALRLLERGDTVCGIDNMNDYYDVRLKEARLQRIKDHRHLEFQKLDIIDREAMAELFQKQKFDAVMHMAAQAGVRYSITNPQSYIDSNLVGFGNILEGCRHSGVKHLAFASSSSVYGANTKLPFSEHDNVDHPVSLYAATKKANELMAHSYAHLYGLPCTGLRYFTYIDDIVEGVVRAIDRPAHKDPAWSADRPDSATSYAPYRIYNIGNNRPVELMRYISVLEACLGKKARMQMLPMQPGDVPATYADTADLGQIGRAH